MSKAARFSSATKATENIGAIIESASNSGAQVITEISLAKVVRDPKNNRRIQLDWDDPRKIDPSSPDAEELQAELAEVEQLAGSISVSQVGLLSPITVIRRGDSFHVVTGHRRVLAFKLLERATIPAIIRTDLLVRFAQFVENVQRRNIELDEALIGMQGMMEEMGVAIIPKMEPGGVVKALITDCKMKQATAYRWAGLLTASPVLHQAVKDGLVRTWSQVDNLVRLDEDELVDEITMLGADMAATSQDGDEGAGEGEGQGRQARKPVQQSKGGRRSKDFVTLGKVRNPNVIKTVIERVMGSAPDDVNWSDLKEVEKAFKKMLEKLAETVQ